MRCSWVFVVGALSLASCSPAPFKTRASFGPPAIVLDPELPERSYRLRLCWQGNAGEYPRVYLGVTASSETPVRATMLVELGDNEPVAIPIAEDPQESAAIGAGWRDAETNEACETGVVVTFALDDPITDGPAEIEWLVGATVSSFIEEGAEDLDLEFHVEELD